MSRSIGGKMTITPDFLYEISSQILAFNRICDYFGLSDEQRKSPEIGEWIIEWIKDVQASYMIRKQVTLTHGKVKEKAPLPPNPLIDVSGNQIDTTLSPNEEDET